MGEREGFFNETKTSMSFIPISKMSLWFPNMKRKKIIMWICVYFNWHMNFDSKKWLKEKLFLWNQSINVIYPIEENEFMVPNNEKHEPMFILINRWTLILKIVGRELLLMKPQQQYRLSQWEKCVYGAQSWKKKEISTWIHVHPNW